MVYVNPLESISELYHNCVYSLKLFHPMWCAWCRRGVAGQGGAGAGGGAGVRAAVRRRVAGQGGERQARRLPLPLAPPKRGARGKPPQGTRVAMCVRCLSIQGRRYLPAAQKRALLACRLKEESYVLVD